MIIAAYIAFMTYGLELYVWGDEGVLEYKELSLYKERLEENLKALEENKTSLSREAESLQYSSEKVALYARKLGYYKPDEQHLQIDGMHLKQDYYVVGELVKPYTRTRVDQNVFRIIALFTGGIAYVFFRYRTRDYSGKIK
ncbi:MAG: septum formation initiator family protein [Spirochaetia bacterium]|nr:septum formation initiator family protein [Spirochaetia bacterium]